MNTKNSKHIRTTFFQVGGAAREIFEKWILELRETHLWGMDDPLFPATAIEQGEDRQFRRGWYRAKALGHRRRCSENFQAVV